MNETDEYVFTQNAIASDLASTHDSLKSTDIFSYVLHIIRPYLFDFLTPSKTGLF